MKTMLCILAVAICAILPAWGQRAYRAPAVTHLAAEGGATNSTLRLSDYARADETSWTIRWLQITATNTVNARVISYSGNMTNALFSVAFTESGTSNITYHTSATLGFWPLADTIDFSTDFTNDTFQVWLGLEMVK